MPRRTCWTEPINPETLVIGVDVAKATHTAVAVRGDGRMAKPVVFTADRAGFQRLWDYAARSQAQLGASSFVVAMEPTGHYAHPLAAFCKAQGVQAYTVQPLHTNRAKELFDGSRRKTDIKDAGVIGMLCRQGKARLWRHLEEPFSTARVLSRRREQSVTQRTQLVNRLHRHVDHVFPELLRIMGKLWSPSVLWLLRHASTPALLLQMGEEGLTAGLKKASRGQLGEDRAQELILAAQSSVGMTSGVDAHVLAILQLLDELELVVRHIGQVEREMEAVLEKVPYAKRLLSIPQFGRITVATLLGEFGDLREYRVAKQLQAMAGTDLIEFTSGTHKGRRRISRRGRHYVRHMLYLAALRLGGGVLKEPRRRMVEDNKVEPMKATVANMCRLIRIMHALVRDDVDFDGKRHLPGK